MAFRNKKGEIIAYDSDPIIWFPFYDESQMSFLANPMGRLNLTDLAKKYNIKEILEEGNYWFAVNVDDLDCLVVRRYFEMEDEKREKLEKEIIPKNVKEELKENRLK